MALLENSGVAGPRTSVNRHSIENFTTNFSRLINRSFYRPFNSSDNSPESAGFFFEKSLRFVSALSYYGIGGHYWKIRRKLRRKSGVTASTAKQDFRKQKYAMMSHFRESRPLSSMWFDGLSPLCRYVKEYAARSQALVVFYQYDDKKRELTSGLTDFVLSEWFIRRMLIRKDVKQRYIEAKKPIREFISAKLVRGESVRIASLASGSALALIEVLSEFAEEKPDIEVLLVDQDSEALDEAVKLANSAGVGHMLDTRHFELRDPDPITPILREFGANFVEVMGLFDYFDSKKVTNYLKAIKLALNNDSVILTANVTTSIPKSEREFLEKVMAWYMRYRDEDKFCRIIEDAGLPEPSLRHTDNNIFVMAAVVLR